MNTRPWQSAARREAQARLERVRAAAAPRRIAEMNVVPYIDVLLVLLVIFMISIPLAYSGVDIKLPATGGEALPSSMLPLTVHIDAEGVAWFADGPGEPQRIAPDELKERAQRVLRRHPRTPVVLKADTRADFGRVIAVMKALKDAGAPNIGLATGRRDASRRT